MEKKLSFPQARTIEAVYYYSRHPLYCTAVLPLCFEMLLNFFSNLVRCVQKCARARAKHRVRARKLERKSANVLNAKERHPFSTVGKQQFPEFTNANDNQLKSFDDTKGRQLMTRHDVSPSPRRQAIALIS